MKQATKSQFSQWECSPDNSPSIAISSVNLSSVRFIYFTPVFGAERPCPSSLHNEVAEAPLAAVVALLGEAAIGKGLGQGLCAAGLKLRASHQAFHEANSSVVRVKANCAAVLGAVVEPLLQGVLVGEIVFGGVEHDLGRRQADALPFEAAVDAPAQDSRPFAP